LNQAGYFVDTICVSFYDQILKRSFTACYVPSVLPIADCVNTPLPDSLTLVMTDCSKPAEACIPIPFATLPGYAVVNNGRPYTGGFSGCDPVERIAYALPNLSQGSPFLLASWSANGQNFSGGAFANAIGLAALFNQLDPAGKWELRDNNTVLAGGKVGNNYGNVRITSAFGTVSNLAPSVLSIPNGTRMTFDYGVQRVTFRQFNTGCIDTLKVTVKCNNCPPAHNYATGTDGVIRWKTTRCTSDTLFCTGIPFQQIQQYAVTDNGQVFRNFEACGSLAGFRLDTGSHVLKIVSPQGACQYDIRFLSDCTRPPQNEVTNVLLTEGRKTVICMDTTRLPGKVFNMTRTCIQKSKNLLDWSFDLQKKCVTLTGLDIGSDTFCVQLCTFGGVCASTQLNVRIQEVQDSIQAVPDFAYGRKGNAVEIPVLSNDLAASGATVTLLTFPKKGQIAPNNVNNSLVYTPDHPDSCYTERFLYRICNTAGICDSAEVSVQIYCDKILIFNGISPNGDSDNDVWHLSGIEAFSKNEVRIFNRWGNLVFEASPYSNNSPWDGTWNGKDLPDGLYYYLIDLGDNSEKQSGWIQLLR
jgi:gliding motility-associated-like protein